MRRPPSNAHQCVCPIHAREGLVQTPYISREWGAPKNDGNSKTPSDDDSRYRRACALRSFSRESCLCSLFGKKRARARPRIYLSPTSSSTRFFLSIAVSQAGPVAAARQARLCHDPASLGYTYALTEIPNVSRVFHHEKRSLCVCTLSRGRYGACDGLVATARLRRRVAVGRQAPHVKRDQLDVARQTRAFPRTRARSSLGLARNV